LKNSIIQLIDLRKGILEVMQLNLTKKIRKILTAFSEINKIPKMIIKYGAIAFLLLFAFGTALVVYSHTKSSYDPYLEFIALSVVKSSFTVLAEAIIGGLLMDFVFKKN
jgi:hypothetical protein